MLGGLWKLSMELYIILSSILLTFWVDSVSSITESALLCLRLCLLEPILGSCYSKSLLWILSLWSLRWFLPIPSIFTKIVGNLNRIGFAKFSPLWFWLVEELHKETNVGLSSTVLRLSLFLTFEILSGIILTTG